LNGAIWPHGARKKGLVAIGGLEESRPRPPASRSAKHEYIPGELFWTLSWSWLS